MARSSHPAPRTRRAATAPADAEATASGEVTAAAIGNSIMTCLSPPVGRDERQAPSQGLGPAATRKTRSRRVACRPVAATARAAHNTIRSLGVPVGGEHTHPGGSRVRRTTLCGLRRGERRFPSGDLPPLSKTQTQTAETLAYGCQSPSCTSSWMTMAKDPCSPCSVGGYAIVAPRRVIARWT